MFDERSFKIYDSMIKSIYRDPDPVGFRPLVIDHLSRLVPFDSAAFFLVNPESNSFDEPYLVGLDKADFDQYKEYYEGKDIYKTAVFSEKGIPPVDRSSDYMDYTQWDKNEHRSDFLLRQGIYHIACLQVIYGNQLVGEISLHRGRKSPDFSDKEMDILKLLHDHVNIGFKTSFIYSNLRGGLGISILDAGYRLVDANRSALNILDMDLAGRQKVYGYLKSICHELKRSPKNELVENGYFKRVSLPLEDGVRFCNVILLDGKSGNDPEFLAVFEKEANPVNPGDSARTSVFFGKPGTGSESFGPTGIQIRLLGNTDVSINGKSVPEKAWQTRKAKALFKYLVLQKGQKVTRDHLMELFWPEAGPEAAAASLRVTLSRMRRALSSAGRETGNKTPFFGEGRGMIWFNPGTDYTLDTEDFEKKSAAGFSELRRGNLDAARKNLEQALELYRGDLLEEDLYEDWPAAERERLKLMLLDALVQLAGLYRSSPGGGNLGRARDILLRALQVNPYREETYLALMEVLVSTGQTGEALLLFEKCRKMLLREFGVRPGKAILRLVEEIRSGADKK